MTEDTSTQFQREVGNRVRMGSILVALLPYVLLVLISVGTGWSFPALVPERIDCSPWLRFLADRDRLGEAVVTSLLMSLIVGVVGTSCGLWVGRAVRQSAGSLPRFLVYLPFVLSPVIVGISLYDLMVRVNLSSTYLGTVLVQLIFATSLAGVYFSELWTSRIDRLEQLVKSLGGGRWAVFRHATWPTTSRLIAVCFVQTTLFSWLDYGLVAIIGGGQVRTLTVRLFGFLREANINQAAQAAIVLLVPTFLGFATSMVLLHACRTPSQEPVR